MAHIYVGFHDQRSSSRVLKPPGGGTSDIFGTDALKKEEKSAPNTPTKDNAAEKIQISPEEKTESTNGVENKQEGDQVNSVERKIENLSIKEENGEKVENHPVESKVEAKDTISSIIRQDENKVQPPAVAETEKKSPQRVPPGGYSSGLW